MPESWVSVEEVARHLVMTKERLPIDRDQGLPAHWVGRLWKFKLAEIDKWFMPAGLVLMMKTRAIMKRTK